MVFSSEAYSAYILLFIYFWDRLLITGILQSFLLSTNPAS